MNSHGLDGFNQDLRKCEGSFSLIPFLCLLVKLRFKIWQRLATL